MPPPGTQREPSATSAPPSQAAIRRDDVLRVVGEVAVHLEHELRSRRQGALESGEIGGTEAGLGGAVEDVHPGKLGRERVGDLPGPVRGVVVDHEHAVTRGVELLGERPDHRLEVVPLVVGRKADDRAHRAILPFPPGL